MYSQSDMSRTKHEFRDAIWTSRREITPSATASRPSRPASKRASPAIRKAAPAVEEAWLRYWATRCRTVPACGTQTAHTKRRQRPSLPGWWAWPRAQDLKTKKLLFDVLIRLQQANICWPQER